MKSTGVVRKLDDLGRITLPIELRRNLNIGEHDPLEIFVDDDRIILRKYEASDIFTGNMDELIDFHDKKVSKQSIMEMARLAGLHVIENAKKMGDISHLLSIHQALPGLFFMIDQILINIPLRHTSVRCHVLHRFFFWEASAHIQRHMIFNGHTLPGLLLFLIQFPL